MSKNSSPNSSEGYQPFPDYEQPFPLLPEEANGWTWKCDAQGTYTACSAEVLELLGIPAQEFIGKQITSFALAPQSAEGLQRLLSKRSLPAEVLLNFLRPDGRPVPASLYILPTRSGENRQGDLHGFVVLLETEDEEPAAPVQSRPMELNIEAEQAQEEEPIQVQPVFPEEPIEAEFPSQEEESVEAQPDSEEETPEVEALQQEHSPAQDTLPQDLLPPASALVLDLLHEARQKLLNLSNVSSSRIIKDESPNGYEEDPTFMRRYGQERQPRDHEIVYKLEWGRKFDLEDHEMLFIQENRYAAPGMRGFFQTLTAPSSILKCDVRSISVVIHLSRWQKSISVSYPQAEENTQPIPLEDFIQNPAQLVPQIKEALKSPWKKQILYRRGVHYLIRKSS